MLVANGTNCSITARIAPEVTREINPRSVPRSDFVELPDLRFFNMFASYLFSLRLHHFFTHDFSRLFASL